MPVSPCSVRTVISEGETFSRTLAQRHDRSPELCAGGEDAVIAKLVGVGAWNQGGEARDELDRLAFATCDLVANLLGRRVGHGHSTRHQGRSRCRDRMPPAALVLFVVVDALIVVWRVANAATGL